MTSHCGEKPLVPYGAGGWDAALGTALFIHMSHNTTECPDCGREMGLVSFVGEKPRCNRCNGASFTGSPWQ